MSDLSKRTLESLVKKGYATVKIVDGEELYGLTQKGLDALASDSKMKIRVARG